MKRIVVFVLIATNLCIARQSDRKSHRQSNSSVIEYDGRARDSSKKKDHSSSKTFVDSIQAFVEALVRADQFSGVIAITKHGHIMFERAYGDADHQTRLRNRMDTKFVIASVTQTFTAVAIAQLVAQGRISLDAPLSEYLPSYSGQNRKATVRQLLLHTGGIADVSKDEAFRRDPKSFRTLADYLKLVQSRPATANPGVEFRYNNGDCVLLAAILEEVSGESYYDYIRKHIFGLAGMSHSGFDLYPRSKDLAIGYTQRNLTTSADATTKRDRHDNQAILPTKASPGVAAYSTARDLVRFGNAILLHQFLKETMTNELLRGRVNTGDAGPHQQYGFGFFDGKVGTVRIVNHGGTGPGIDVGFDLYPELGYVVVVMSNYDPPAAQRLRDQIRITISTLN